MEPRKRPARRISELQRSYKEAERLFKNMLPVKGHGDQALTEFEEKFKDLSNKLRLEKLKAAPVAKQKVKQGQLQKQKRKENQDRFVAVKRAEEKRQAQIAKEKYRIEQERDDRKKIPTRVIDTAALVSVRIDKNTVVWVKPHQDPEEVKQRFRQRIKIEKF